VKTTTSISRRDLLKSGGALIVSFGVGAVLPGFAQNGAAPLGRGRAGAPSAPTVDDFIAIHADGSVTISTSHVDVGTGIATAYRQTAAEELDIPVERFTVVEGDTATVPNHGGTGGSSGVPRGAADIRRAAATARQALLDLGAARLNLPASDLTISNGEVRPVKGGQGVAVATLIGDKRFSMSVNPTAKLKEPSTYTVVGKPILRTDLSTKALGSHVYVQNFTVPGMLHARIVQPPAIGAAAISVDESSIHAIPDARVVKLESAIAVVTKDEWAAVRAARELKIKWTDSQTLPGSDGFDHYLRQAPVERDQSSGNQGDAKTAYSTAAKKLSATYYWPFQSHASLGPSCVVADVKESGTTVWSSTQDAFGLRSRIAQTLGTPQEKVRVIYLDGSGSYGTNGALLVAVDAALLSRAVGQPVRLQWMRQDELGWDPKGPAQLLDLRGGIDSHGNIVAWETETWLPVSGTTQNADPPYAVENMSVIAHQLKDTPLPLSNLRAPGKIGNVFSVESFVDEMAVAAGLDTAAFRRRGLKDPRALAVIDRATETIAWKARPSPNPSAAEGNFQIGRGIAYMRYKQAENYVAIAMEVAVERSTGKIMIRRITCAHDCGLIVNPDGLRNQVEGNIMHTLSRTLHEEVKFDRSKVTSVDWSSYPVLRFPEAPKIEVALIDRPDQPSYGAGEAASAPVAAALANAIFDATGVRLRTVPFTLERVKAAMGSA
jgi:nicotinate dehydrogenase subunit B